MKKVLLVTLIFFFIFSCKKDKDSDTNLMHIHNLSSKINEDLKEISHNIIELANKVQISIPFESPASKSFEKTYYYKKYQILYTKFNENYSAVYFPANKAIDQTLKNRIINTERLDQLFYEFTNLNALVEQVYFLDTNSFLRIYPYINVINYLSGSIDLTKLCAYKSVEKAPFNDIKSYWLNKPYADPYGRGWIVSCMQPIYYRDHFKGIISGDISINSLRSKYFSSNNESLFLLDSDGKLIISTKEAGKIINAPVFKEYQYFKPVESDVFMNSSPILIDHQNKSLTKAIENLMKDKTQEEFNINNKKYKIYRAYIPETNWYLFKIIN